MSSIRVTYSGLIAFAISLSGVLTGTLFVVIVTRNLNPDDFGLWTLIGSMVVYAGIINPIVTYWSIRQLARGEEVGKTAFATGGMLSVGSFAAYSVIALGVSYQIGADFSILILAGALVPLVFISNILNGICISFRPQAMSYGLLTFESTKVPLGFIFVIFLEYGIVGVILTTIASNLIRIAVLIFFARKKIIGEIKRKIMKFWFKMSWLTMYLNLPGMMISLDVLIFATFTNSLSALAYWGIARTISNKIGNAESISQGLYPKLLATGKQEIARLNLQVTLFLAIPFLGASIIFAKPMLYILNPIYVDGIFIAIILSFRAFIAMLMSIFFHILQAYETVDLDEQATFKKYIKSKLFFLPTLQLLLTGTYLVSLMVFLIFKPLELSEVEIVTGWTLIFVAVHIPFTIYGAVASKKQHQIIFPVKESIKYSLATIASMIILFFITENFLTYTSSIWDFVPQLIPLVIFGGLLYLVITVSIDSSARKLVKSFINEIKR